MKKIKLSTKVACNGRSRAQANGIEVYERASMQRPDTVDNPSPRVVVLQPTFNGVPRSCEIEVPVEDTGMLVEAIGKSIEDVFSLPLNPVKTRYEAWMHELNPISPNSFESYLYKAYTRADEGNAARLRAAFPDFFINKKKWK